jgi:hypothetical protein
MAATLVSLCATAGGLLFSAAPALAAPPKIEEEFTTEVASTSVTLQAKLNPEGAPTSYVFEYAPAGGTFTPIPEPEGAGTVAEGISPVPLSVHVQHGLSPSTSYEFRLVAKNSVETVIGKPVSFTTQTAGGELVLPDNRAWELVSPPQKDGAEILGIGGAGETPGGGDATQASEAGTSVTYIANAPVGANPPGSTFSTQLFSTRGAGGWSAQNISVPHEHALGTDHILEEGEEYQRFSSDLSRAILVPIHSTPQPSLAPEVHQEVRRFQEVYVRDDITGVFQALVTAEPLPEEGPQEGGVRFEGGSPDLSHLLFHGPAGLDPGYPGAGGLYEWAGGQAQLVGVLPGGAVDVPAVLGGSTEEGPASRYAVHHAISNDGTRVVWGEGSQLFTRDMATGETVQVDAARGGGGASGGGAFLAASSDGSRVFLTDRRELTSGAHEGGLFMFDVADQKLTDLIPALTGAQVQDFFGANEAGTSLYVVASAVLTGVANSSGETAQAGASNLYLLREAPAGSGSWSATFVTAGAEEGPGGILGSEAPLARQAVRVSPNGRYLAFMSRQSLTGYDNHDANSGAPDGEVYLYDAEANRLVCASCDPTGARPVGEYITGERPVQALDPWRAWPERWLAAAIPGWTPSGHEVTTGYQPRYLSDSGRLYFNSADALVPADVNGRVDVYQYEPEGVAGCQAPGYGQSASVRFSEALAGCVGLISAGTDRGDSVFFDASASGNDVFFTTQDGLVSQDKDGTSDMYDARVCTAAAPCLPPPAAQPPPCDTEASCRAAPTPQPDIFGTPASGTFSGPGNLTPPPPTTGKTATQIRAEKLAKALKLCRKKHGKKRAECEKQAKKSYGASKAKKATNKRRAKR